MANTETKVDLVINRMSQSKYEQLKSAGQLDPNQIYMTTDGTDPVPETRKVNGQTLEADVNLTGADIAVSTSDSTKINIALAGKAATNHTHSNYVPTSRTVNNKALSGNVTLTADDVGGLPATSTGPGYYSLLDIADLNLPQNTFINGEMPITEYNVVSPNDSAQSGQAADASATYNELHRLEELIDDIDLSGYVPTSRTIAGQDLTANITAATLATAIGLDNCVKKNSSNTIEANEGSLGFSIYNDSPTSGADAYLYLASGNGEFGVSTSSTDTYMLVNGDEFRFPSGGGTFLTSIPTSYKTYADTLTQLGTDGFKRYSDTKTQLVTDGFKTYADTKTALDSVYKPLQTAKTDPTASGNSTTFIDTITQNANGVITATKKNVSFSGYKPTQTAKTSPTASGNATAFIDTISQDANGVITATKKNVSFSGYKTTQTAVSDPTASGTATSFIDTISQNANGVITPTKKNLPTASTTTAGIVQLNNGRTSTSTTVAPTANALKSAYDNCIHTSGTNQVINDCTTFRFDGTADWTVGDGAAHVVNNIELRDVNDYLGGYLQTQRTAANNYVTTLVCRAPTGASGAASSTALTLLVTPSNTKYVGFPTPAATSNAAIGATTEWVNSRIDESWKRVTVGSSGVLENHAINVLTMTGTHKLYPPYSLDNLGNRHFYLLAINTNSQNRTLKFYRYGPDAPTTNTITYYMDDGYTPVTSISNASYFYEFYETSQNMFYVKQTKIVDKSSVIGTSS